MNIVTVCGMGMGSSLILKMNIDSALQGLGIDADVQACDINSVGQKEMDLIVTTKEFGDLLTSYEVPKILLTNVINKKEIEEELKKYFNV